jgi:hypothetical protein
VLVRPGPLSDAPTSKGGTYVDALVRQQRKDAKEAYEAVLRGTVSLPNTVGALLDDSDNEDRGEDDAGFVGDVLTRGALSAIIANTQTAGGARDKGDEDLPKYVRTAVRPSIRDAADAFQLSNEQASAFAVIIGGFFQRRGVVPPTLLPAGVGMPVFTSRLTTVIGEPGVGKSRVRDFTILGAPRLVCVGEVISLPTDSVETLRFRALILR